MHGRSRVAAGSEHLESRPEAAVVGAGAAGNGMTRGEVGRSW